MRLISVNNLSALGPPVSDRQCRVYILLTVLVFTWVASCTARPLPLRILSTLLLAGNIYLALTMPGLLGHIPGFDPLIANFLVAWWMRAVDLFSLRDDSQMPKKADDPKEKIAAKHNFAPMTCFRAFDYLVVNHRMIGTPYEARGVQPFDKAKPHWVPDRMRFLRLKLTHLVAAYIALDLLVTQQPAPPQRLFAREQEFFFSRITEVTWEELGFRWLTQFNLWASCTCLIEYIYAAFALVGVASGLYEARDFPPLLGDWRDETSVKNHWGRVWHQLFQVPYTSFARAFCRATLPASFLSSRAARRYITAFLVFAISGLAHAVQPIGVTGGWPQIRQFFFFFPAQVFALLIEDAWWSCYGKLRPAGDENRLFWWESILGFLWVQVWMSWTCSIWVYPTLRRGGEGMMPWSILSPLRKTWEMRNLG